MNPKKIEAIDSKTLRSLLDQKENIQLIDVREFPEYQKECIEGAVLVPLSSFDKNTNKILPGKKICLMCKSGMRSRKAAEQLQALGHSEIQVLEGGIEDWRQQGFPIQKGHSNIWAMDRQVRFTAGTLVLSGVILSLTVHPSWIGLSLFVACGLIFSAVTDTCGMALMLGRLPWNQQK